MNIYLLQLVGKWINLLIVSVVSLIGNFTISDSNLTAININKNKNNSIVNTVVEFNTIKTYSTKLPYNKVKTMTAGEDGIVYKDAEGNVVQVLKEMVTEELEIGTGPSGNFTGRMTGYGADCIGCSGAGNVSCRTEAGTKHSLVDNGEYYTDDEYGEVRILSAAQEKFPCGTIIKVSHPTLGDFYGVVLDTGIAMNQAYSNGEILIDLAYKTEKDPMVYGATSKSVKYEVQRWGW